MTPDENPMLATKIEAIEEFSRRLTQGFQSRTEETVEASPATLEILTTSQLGQLAKLGVILGKTRWKIDESEVEGCFLWLGGWEYLLGGEPRAAELLTTEEIGLLDQSLRLIMEEGGEGELPLDWTSLEGIESEKLPEALTTLGVPEEFDAAQVRVGVGAKELTLLFVAAAGAAASRTPKAKEGAKKDFKAASYVGASEPNREFEASPSKPVDVHNLRHLLDVKIPLRIRLGTTRMSLDEVLRIAPGAILELDRREEEPLEVLANGRVIARGEVVVVDERFGLRITEIGSSSDRLQVAE